MYRERKSTERENSRCLTQTDTFYIKQIPNSQTIHHYASYLTKHTKIMDCDQFFRGIIFSSYARHHGQGKYARQCDSPHHGTKLNSFFYILSLSCLLNGYFLILIAFNVLFLHSFIFLSLFLCVLSFLSCHFLSTVVEENHNDL